MGAWQSQRKVWSDTHPSIWVRVESFKPWVLVFFFFLFCDTAGGSVQLRQRWGRTNQYNPVSWDYWIHRPKLCRRVRSPPQRMPWTWLQTTWWRGSCPGALGNMEYSFVKRLTYGWQIVKWSQTFWLYSWKEHQAENNAISVQRAEIKEGENGFLGLSSDIPRTCPFYLGDYDFFVSQQKSKCSCMYKWVYLIFISVEFSVSISWIY